MIINESLKVFKLINFNKEYWRTFKLIKFYVKYFIYSSANLSKNKIKTWQYFFLINSLNIMEIRNNNREQSSSWRTRKIPIKFKKNIINYYQQIKILSQSKNVGYDSPHERHLDYSCPIYLSRIKFQKGTKLKEKGTINDPVN